MPSIPARPHSRPGSRPAALGWTPTSRSRCPSASVGRGCSSPERRQCVIRSRPEAAFFDPPQRSRWAPGPLPAVSAPGRRSRACSSFVPWLGRAARRCSRASAPGRLTGGDAPSPPPASAMVTAAMADSDVAGIAAPRRVGGDGAYHLYGLETPRAMAPDDLARSGRSSRTAEGHRRPDVGAALVGPRADRRPSCAGSLYLVGDVRRRPHPTRCSTIQGGSTG